MDISKNNKNIDVQNIMKRILIKKDIKDSIEQTLDQKIDRYLEIDHQGIIGNHHFAAASSECINLYRDAYYISAVMVSQAVNEGIIKFVAERNGIKENKEHDKLMGEFVHKGIISSGCAESSRRIWGSFRNDVHHMNPKVASIPFQQLAKRNLQDLAIIEKEIFGTDFSNGELVPHNPKYWDVQNDGTVPAFLRFL